MNKKADKLKEYLSKETPEALLLAILEYDKLLVQKLNESTIIGKNTDQKLRAAIEILSDPLGLASAREVAEDIKTKPDYELTDPFGENILTQYEKAISDLDKKIPQNKMKRKYQKVIHSVYGQRKKYKSFSLVALGILIGILFFADTSIGNNITGAFLVLVHGIFKGLFIFLGSLIAVAAIIVLVVMTIERLRK